MTAPLRRRLGLRDAVVIGMASMLGAGVFSAFAPAAASAGAGLLIGLALAVAVAYANAAATAQLAAAHPTSGGAYAFGRAELGAWWGYAAGWSFVVGKLASCAAMAMTFAAYAVPAAWQRPVAVAAVVLLVTVNVLGVTRTAALARVLVSVVLVGLVFAVLAGRVGWVAPGPPIWHVEGGPYGVLQSGGILFFALAGYARVATMGEEVRDPTRVIPRAILGALAAVTAIYAALAVTLLLVLGPARLAVSSAPIAELAAAAGGWTSPVVAVAAAAGSLGALLSLIAGIGRTVLAMAREGDLPRAMAVVGQRRGTPHRAEIVVGAVIVVTVLVVDLRGAIAFSSFAVLLYYAVANLAAIRQRDTARRTPRALQAFGIAGCLLLALSVPWQGLAIGTAVLVAGCLGRAVARRLRRAA